MKQKIMQGLIVVWVLVATFFLARFWLNYHFLFPPIPEPFWIWITDLYGATDAEQVADVEILVALALALLIVILLTASSRFALKKIQMRRSQNKLQKGASG